MEKLQGSSCTGRQQVQQQAANREEEGKQSSKLLRRRIFQSLIFQRSNTSSLAKTTQSVCHCGVLQCEDAQSPAVPSRAVPSSPEPFPSWYVPEGCPSSWHGCSLLSPLRHGAMRAAGRPVCAPGEITGTYWSTVTL